MRASLKEDKDKVQEILESGCPHCIDKETGSHQLCISPGPLFLFVCFLRQAGLTQGHLPDSVSQVVGLPARTIILGSSFGFISPRVLRLTPTAIANSIGCGFDLITKTPTCPSWWTCALLFCHFFPSRLAPVLPPGLSVGVTSTQKPSGESHFHVPEGKISCAPEVLWHCKCSLEAKMQSTFLGAPDKA